MYPRKVLIEGKKFIQVLIDGNITHIRLAPRNLVLKIAEENEIKNELMLKFEPDKVPPKGIVNVKGSFMSPSKEGIYKASLKLEGLEGTYEYKFATDLTVKGNITIEAKEIQKIYRKCFKDISICDINRNWLFSDQKYEIANIDQIDILLKKSKTYQLKYEVEEHDCDDYAFALMGYLHYDPNIPKWQSTVNQAIFITWVILEVDGKLYGHALESCCDGSKIYMIEPQNGKIFDVPDNFRLYLICG